MLPTHTSATRGARVTEAPPPPLSATAHALGLHTVAEVRAEYAAQREGWRATQDGRSELDYPPGPHGPRWHCCLCDQDFFSSSGASKHMRAHGGERDHPVLRVDWYEH